MTNAIKLPLPDTKGTVCIEETIKLRRSVRRFKVDPLSLKQISQILWSAQGITDNKFYRAIPSAGGTYPLELYIAAGSQCVEGLQAGIYRYNPDNHSLNQHLDGDLRVKLSKAALNQDCIVTAPVDIIVCASYIRTTKRYGERGIRYVHMEVGHLGQNIALQAIAAGLASVMIGAFQDDEVAEVLSLEGQIKPLYIIPIGKPL